MNKEALTQYLTDWFNNNDDIFIRANGRMIELPPTIGWIIPIRYKGKIDLSEDVIPLSSKMVEAGEDAYLLVEKGSLDGSYQAYECIRMFSHSLTRTFINVLGSEWVYNCKTDKYEDVSRF